LTISLFQDLTPSTVTARMAQAFRAWPAPPRGQFRPSGEEFAVLLDNPFGRSRFLESPGLRLWRGWDGFRFALESLQRGGVDLPGRRQAAANLETEQRGVSRLVHYATGLAGKELLPLQCDLHGGHRPLCGDYFVGGAEEDCRNQQRDRRHAQIL